MFRRKGGGLALLVAIGMTAGCASSGGAGLADVTPAASGEIASSVTDILISDTGAETTPQLQSHADWSVDVNNPFALREFSSAVIAGQVAEVQRSYVDANGIIVTAYTVKVDKVYKGEGLPNTITVVLPGGSMPLGEYISSLDKLGLYEMKLGRKDPELLRNAGLDPARESDPRTMDPATIVAENWGTNPTSRTLVEKVQPESWVIFLGAVEGELYYGAAFDHALSYLKDGLIHGVHPETLPSSVSESEFTK